jgi:Cupin domain
MIEEMFRVVTGNDQNGKSYFVDTSTVPKIEAALYPGATYWLVWGTDDSCPEVGKNAPAVHRPFFPGPGGSRLLAVRFAPMTAAGGGAGKTTSPAEFAAMRGDAEEKFPGLFDLHAADKEDTAFHTSNSVDYAFVVEGEIFVRVDNGHERRLTAGSFVVQRGTRHAWVNRSHEATLIVFVILGARRVSPA